MLQTFQSETNLANFEANVSLKCNVQRFSLVTGAFDVRARAPSCGKHPSCLLKNSFVAVKSVLVATQLNIFAGIYFFEYFADIVTGIDRSFLRNNVKLC